MIEVKWLGPAGEDGHCWCEYAASSWPEWAEIASFHGVQGSVVTTVV